MNRVGRAGWKYALDAQMGVWRWTRTDPGRYYLDGAVEVAGRDLDPKTQRLIESSYQGIVASIENSDPIYVSSEMCELVEAAAESFAPEPLLPSDLLTDHGFLVYERPFEVQDRYDRPVTIAAVSWAPFYSANDEYLDLHRSGASMEQINEWLDTGKLERSGIAIALYALPEDEGWTRPDLLGPPPPVVITHVTPWWYDMSFEGNEVDANGRPTGAAWWWKVVQTTFRLMQQRIATRRRERPDRPQRREMLRRGFTDREVLVVRLRREKGEHEEHDGGTAGYSHRFIVSGHWRQQWYPSAQTHRQIWISPYVKGPEEAPLVVKPRRAFAWQR